MSLATKQCVPCDANTPPLTQPEIEGFVSQLQPSWSVIDNHHLEREFTFADFKSALAFTNQIGGLAEQEGHHPDLFLSWGQVKIQIWTHSIGGLSEADFVLAAKVEQIFPG